MNLFLLGYLAAGQAPPRVPVLIAGLGVALVLLSLYPASQVYQMPEDARRGDRTFARCYGLVGVRRLFLVCYPSGALIIATTLLWQWGWLGAGLLLPAATAGAVSWRVLKGLRGLESDYASVMRLKYATSGFFVAFIVTGLTVIHYR